MAVKNSVIGPHWRTARAIERTKFGDGKPHGPISTADNETVTTCSLPILPELTMPRAKPQAAMRALAMICVLGAIASRLVYLIEPFNGDGAMFAYMGKLVAQGGRFGTDLVDNKFPTAGFVTSIIWRAFDPWWPGYVILQLLMTFSATAILVRSAARAFGEEARWATFLPTIVLLNLNATVMGGFQLETIQTFFACIAAACSLEALTGRDWRDAFAAGLAAGCATLVKPTGGAVLGALFLAYLPSPALQGRVRSLLSAILGFSVPIFAAGIWLFESDQLTQLPIIARQISEYASSTTFELLDLYRPLCLILLFGVAVLIRGWVYRRRSVPNIASLSIWVFAASWLVLEFIGVVVQRRMYAYHFLPLAAPSALMLGALPRRTTVAQLAGILAIPLIFNIWGSIETAQEQLDHPPIWPAVTQWLNEHCIAGERIWRDQTPDVLLHSDLRSASRIQLTFIFMNSDTSAQRFSAVLLDDLAVHRPRFIVLPADMADYVHHHTKMVSELARNPQRAASFARAWGDIEAFAQKDYLPVQKIGDEMIWQRKPQP
ncbi:MAG TPA: glycosyltransferase family 39 protein [Tepidisphaeraceae bacterium]|nr:glycosyltransferase family 39 protein [Tepidisphaeraceae bacterium]